MEKETPYEKKLRELKDAYDKGVAEAKKEYQEDIESAMKETPTEEWEKNNLIEHNGNYYVRCEAHEEVVRRLQEKHKEALTSNDAELRRKIEGMRQNNEENPYYHKFAKLLDGGKSMDDYQRAYNQALDEVLAKLSPQSDKTEGLPMKII